MADTCGTENNITLSRDELMSDHVDGLLKRQMSLRGERVAGRMKRSWFMSNWFILMMVGGGAAFGAWAIIEPHFNDLFYTQGVVEVIDPIQGPILEDIRLIGSIRVNGEVAHIIPQTREMLEGDEEGPLDLSKIAVGSEVGLYVDVAGVGDDGNPLLAAMYVDASPEPLPPGESTCSVSEQSNRHAAISFFVFSLVAGLVGLSIGAADGIVCRLPRRAFAGGIVGLIVGFIGGLISSVLAGLVYAPLNSIAVGSMDEGRNFACWGFGIQIMGRSLAWALAGMTMGLGQGIILRSRRLLLYGFLGGIIGGLLGGLLFDPIDLLLVPGVKTSGHLSRMIGFTIIGLTVGFMIGMVELLARDAWLRMTEGALAGKEFLIFKDRMRIGSSPRSEIYLFSDDQVAGLHATIMASGDQCQIESHDRDHPTELNGRPVKTARLRHGDRITIGRTSFVYENRQH